MSICHARGSVKRGVKGGPSSTSYSQCLNCTCMTLWTRISMAFSCSRTPISLVRIVRNRIEDRNCGNENMQSSHPHSGQCTAWGWIWSRSHRRSRAPAWGGISSKDNEGIHSNNLLVFLASNTQTGTLFRLSDRRNTFSPTWAPASVVPRSLSYTTRARHRMPCERCAVVFNR